MTTTLEEHRGYIADSSRLEHYREAIAVLVKPGDTVADLGCGFGVLGLMCLEAGAAQVWGIDSSPAIDIAREAAARAGLADRYLCLRELTGRAELPERVDLLICDHVGYMGIDYGILTMLADARKRLLKPGGRIVPQRLRLFAAGIASPRCRTVADAWAEADIPATYHWLADYGRNTKHPLSLTAEEVATAPQLLFDLDLHQDQPELCAGKTTLAVEQACALDGLAVWFECDLAPGVTMTNSPLTAERIDRHQALLPLAAPIDCADGDGIGVKIAMRHDDDIVSWSATNQRSGARARQSTLQGKILGPELGATAQGRVPQIGRLGALAQIVAGHVDGTSTARDIADRIVAAHPGLLPSEAALRAAVLAELARLER